jgi:hypothetical protein
MTAVSEEDISLKYLVVGISQSHPLVSIVKSDVVIIVIARGIANHLEFPSTQ